MKLRYSARTDVGKKREINEDSYGPTESPAEGVAGQLMVVCDGMGGHAAGEVASSIGVETILQSYYASNDEDRSAALKTAFEQANQRIFEHGHGTMGTTGVAALLHHNTLYIANVGDSRAYMVRQGVISQVSRDHSYVAEQVQAGLLTPEQARTSLVRNIITRALGHQPDVKVDIFTVPVVEGDVIILSSDGMYGLVEDEEIQQAVAHLPPEKATSALINLANKRGGVDNITVVVAQIEQMDGPAVFDGTTHTLPAVNAADLTTERMEVAPPPAPSEAETLTIPPAPAPAARAHAPTDKFPTIIGQQAIRPADPPAAAPPPPSAAPASGGERAGTWLGLLLSLLVLLLLGGIAAVASGLVSNPLTGETNAAPTALPSIVPPTIAPSVAPSPSTEPTSAPTSQPTQAATQPPTSRPTQQATSAASVQPTRNTLLQGATAATPAASRTQSAATTPTTQRGTQQAPRGAQTSTAATPAGTSSSRPVASLTATRRTALRPTVAAPKAAATESLADQARTAIPTVIDLIATYAPTAINSLELGSDD